MISQGILVFENASAMGDLMALRFGGLSLVDRGIRTMVRAGLKRILVIVPAGAAPVPLSQPATAPGAMNFLPLRSAMLLIGKVETM